MNPFKYVWATVKPNQNKINKIIIIIIIIFSKDWLKISKKLFYVRSLFFFYKKE